MKITSVYGFETDDPKLIAFHESRVNPIKVSCITDNPSGTFIDKHEFKKGDIVEIHGLVGKPDGGFEVCIPSVLGFYDADAFELIAE